MQFLQATALAKAADYVRTVHQVTTDGASLDDLLRPAFWAHVVGKIKVGDLIDVIDAQGAFDVTLRFVEVQQGFARVRPLRLWRDETVTAKAEETTDEVEAVPGLIVKWRGPRAKFGVVRASDQSEAGVLKSGFASKADAMAWAVDHKDVA